MRRRTFDSLMSTAGLVVTVMLLVAGALLLWAHSFVDSNVHTQLAQQKISFPAKGSPELSSNADIKKYVTPYAGQQVTSGQQAEVFANHYIANHLKAIGHGQTYSEVSARFLTMKPTDPNYQAVATERTTLFQGETLRGMLLNAYAFWKMGQIALWAGIASLVGAALMLLLSALGLLHARRVAPETEVFPAERRSRTRQVQQN